MTSSTPTTTTTDATTDATNTTNTTKKTWQQVLEETPIDGALDKSFRGIPKHLDVKDSATFASIEEELLRDDASALMMMVIQPSSSSSSLKLSSSEGDKIITTATTTAAAAATKASAKPTATKTATNTNPATTVVTLLHHLAKLEVVATGEKDDKTAVSSSPKKTVTSPVYVALGGTKEEAQPVELPLLQALATIDVKAPTWKALKDMDPEQLAKSLETTASSSSLSSYSLRSIQFLPPYIYKALLKSTDRSPKALLVEALRAIKAHQDQQQHVQQQQLEQKKTDSKASEGIKSEKKDEEQSNDADVFYHSIVAFLWTAATASNDDVASRVTSTGKGRLEVDITASETPEVIEWNKKLHQQKNEAIAPVPKVETTATTTTTTADASKVTAALTKPMKKTRSWQENFLRLVVFKDAHGDCNVPREYTKDTALGEWVKNQRSIRKTLPADRRTQLESINFTFSRTQLDRSKKIWDANFARFCDAMNGNKGNVAKTIKDDKTLQHWVTIQRQTHRRGNLDLERKSRLDAVGFVFKIKNDYAPRKKNDMQWQKGYAKLVEFHKVHKHVNVPKRSADSRPLWEWVYSQRKAHSEKRLIADRIQLMEDLGMTWEHDMGQVIRDQQWNSKFDNAKAFFAKHEHLEVPRSGKFGDTNLLKWLLRQREQFKNDKLSDSRKKLLEGLKFDFEGGTERRDKLLEELNWKNKYQDVEAYKKEVGAFPDGGAAAKNANEKSLGKWLAKQIVAYQFHDLEQSRKEILDKLGVAFPTQMPEPPPKKRTPSALAKTEQAKVAEIEKAPVLDANKATEAGPTEDRIIVVDKIKEDSKELATAAANSDSSSQAKEAKSSSKSAGTKNSKEESKESAVANDDSSSSRAKEAESSSKSADTKNSKEEWKESAAANDDSSSSMAKEAESSMKPADTNKPKDESKKSESATEIAVAAAPKDSADKEAPKITIATDEAKRKKRKAEDDPCDSEKDKQSIRTM